MSIGFLEVFGVTEDLLKTSIEYISDFFLDIDEFLPQVFNFTKSFTIGVYNWLIGIIVSFYILGNKEKLNIQAQKIVYAL